MIMTVTINVQLPIKPLGVRMIQPAPLRAVMVRQAAGAAPGRASEHHYVRVGSAESH